MKSILKPSNIYQKSIKNQAKINQKVEKAVKNNCFCKKINQKIEKAMKNNRFCKKNNQQVEKNCEKQLLLQENKNQSKS